MAEQSKREVGKKLFKDVLLWDPPGGELTKMTATSLDYCFGEVWADETLSIKQRRLISLTCAAFVGDPGLSSHIHGALGSGDYTVEELDAWVVHLSVYAGHPIASRAQNAVRAEVARSGG
jgi:4-carboxymuconolactone decarboxylase